MRRLMAITAFALFLTVPVWAQRGGGGHGGGFAGGHAIGFGGGHGGGFAGGHAIGFSGGHFSGHAGFSSRGAGFIGTHPSRIGGAARVGAFNHGTRFRTGPFLHNGFHGNRFHNFGFNNCFGLGCWFGWGSPWWGWGWGPWGWDSGSSYDQDNDRDRAYADQLNAENIELQQMLRREESDRDQDAYYRRRPEQPQQQAQEKEGAPILPPTVLVYRDQRRQEVTNYAIVGQTLWAFAPQRQKIPLSDLDLAATTKANDDRGVSFRVPGTSEGQ
jgi:hypothetical protein